MRTREAGSVVKGGGGRMSQCVCEKIIKTITYLGDRQHDPKLWFQLVLTGFGRSRAIT
jgi:hypothetical protein